VTQELKTGPGEHSASLRPDGTMVAVIDYSRTKDDRYGVKIWSVEPGSQLVAKLEIQSPVFVQFTPDGNSLLVITTTGACIWKVLESRPAFDEIALKDRFLCAQISPLGDLFVTTRLMNDNCARMWNIDTGEPWGPPLAHKSRVQCIAFSESGAHLVTGSADSTARVWDTLTGEPVTTPLPHKGQLAHLSVSPNLDPLRIATITDGHSSADILWEVFSDGARGTALRVSEGKRVLGDKFGCAAFDQTGRALAIGNHHLDESHGNGKLGACWWLIDANTLDPLLPAVEAEWHVRQIGFSPNCRNIVVGCGWAYNGAPGCITVYDVGQKE
jgi:WD40 repeat protein